MDEFSFNPGKVDTDRWPPKSPHDLAAHTWMQLVNHPYADLDAVLFVARHDRGFRKDLAKWAHKQGTRLPQHVWAALGRLLASPEPPTTGAKDLRCLRRMWVFKALKTADPKLSDEAVWEVLAGLPGEGTTGQTVENDFKRRKKRLGIKITDFKP